MTDYEKWLSKRLTQVYEENSLQQVRAIDQLRLILFSDLHKGQRDGADDFEQCEAVYLAALDYYWPREFELFLLGDIEELWEVTPKQVITAYKNVLEMEKRFAEARNPRRYVRLMGNHDDLWYEPDEVTKHLGEFLSGSVVVEGVRLRIKEQGQELGELFLVHGHQGTLFSDRYRKFSQWVVQNIWRPIQRLLRLKTTTPSNDFKLKTEHERAMYAWAASGRDRVLIAGHTHHPVWEGLSYQQALARKRAEGLEHNSDVAWIEEQIGGRIELPGEKPCYFNTGCCCFSDGSITAIEIEAGEIRLVRWENPDQPTRTSLFTARLADILRAVAAS